MDADGSELDRLAAHAARAAAGRDARRRRRGRSEPDARARRPRGRPARRGDARGAGARGSPSRSFGLGPLEPLLRDPAVDEIMVSRHAPVWVERARTAGGDRRALRLRGGAAPRDRADPRAARAAGRTRPSRCATRGCPTARASTWCCRRWRSTARCSPSAASGRAASGRTTSWRTGTARRAAARRSSARAVAARRTLLICGGTGSGKTTTLGALAAFADPVGADRHHRGRRGAAAARCRTSCGSRRARPTSRAAAR